MSDMLLNAIAARIRMLREAQGVSQDALAVRAGIDRSYLGRWSVGSSKVSILTAARIARALGVPLAGMLEASPSSRGINGRTLIDRRRQSRAMRSIGRPPR